MINPPDLPQKTRPHISQIGIKPHVFSPVAGEDNANGLKHFNMKYLTSGSSPEAPAPACEATTPVSGSSAVGSLTNLSCQTKKSDVDTD